MEFHVKQLLQQGGYSCVILSEDGTVFQSKKSGITPLMDFISENQTSAKEAADKVVGGTSSNKS